jgi:hypothetical protein
VGFFGKLICVCALWLPILPAQIVERHNTKVQLLQVASFERKTNRLVDRFNTSGRTLVDAVIELAFKYH